MTKKHYIRRQNSTSKYHASQCEYRGITFASRLEMRRYIVLAAAQAEGRIHNLRLQVHYPLLPQVHYIKTTQLKTKIKFEKRELFKPCEYVADFVYACKGYIIVEDTKGMVTPDYAIKEKLMYDKHGIVINRITKATAEIGTPPPTIYKPI